MKNSLKICSTLSLLTLSSVLLLLKVDSLEIFLFVCVGRMRTCEHIHVVCTHGCTYAHRDACIHIHICVAHTHTCVYTCMAEASGAFPGGEGFCYLVYFPSLQ